MNTELELINTHGRTAAMLETIIRHSPTTGTTAPPIVRIRSEEYIELVALAEMGLQRVAELAGTAA